MLSKRSLILSDRNVSSKMTASLYGEWLMSKVKTAEIDRPSSQASLEEFGG